MRKTDLIKLKLYYKDNKVVRTLISTIIGELDRISKDPSESQIISLIKKMRDENEEVLKSSNNDDIKEEIKFLTSLIPSELSESEIIEIINSNEFLTIKDCMNFFKNNYAGRYDGKLVSSIIKSKLS